jgi:hypothetical protein
VVDISAHRLVLAKEHVLQRCGRHGELLDTQVGEVLHGEVEIVAVHRELGSAILTFEVVHVRKLLQRPAIATGAYRDGGAHQMTKFVERARSYGAAGADDRHVVTEPFDLGEDVAGQQHRSTAVGNLVDTLAKSPVHQRVQARCRFVEDVQLGVAAERGDDGHLLAVALGIRTSLFVRVEVEPLDQLVTTPGVDGAVAAQPSQEVDGLLSSQVGPQRHVARHIGDPAVQRHRVAPRIAAEQSDVAAVGAQ